MKNHINIDDYTKPGFYVDSAAPNVLEFARIHGRAIPCGKKRLTFFFAVRDGFRYDPYHIIFEPEEFKASVRIARDSGFCIHKAIILAAVSRAAGIPARLAFADVRSHLNTKRLRTWCKRMFFTIMGSRNCFLTGGG
ncbi:MAG: transglutaminase family protein [Candidatus Syntrophopropionicum ammoniitolerans]